MFKLILVICFLSCAFCCKSQTGRYVLRFQFRDVMFDTPAVLSIRHDGGISRMVINKPIKQWVLDSVIFYPQSVQVDLFPNCSKDEIAQLLAIVPSTKKGISTNFFLVDSMQCMAIQKDTLFLIHPNKLQVRYHKAAKEVGDRIESFNVKINNTLLQAYKLAGSQREKDSLKTLAEVLFKVNVARVNLDSTIFPLIENNLDNCLSFYGIINYLYVSRVLGMPIPKAKLIEMLQTMSAYLKEFSIWKELLNRLNALPTEKTLAGSRAPEFRDLYDTSGLPVCLKDFKRHIIFIDFWAAWCVPCKAQLPYLKKIYENLSTKNVVFLGISLDDNLKKWKNEIRRSALTWVQATDLKSISGLTVTEYNIITIPHNFLIDENGIIVKENIPIENLEGEIRKLQIK